MKLIEVDPIDEVLKAAISEKTKLNPLQVYKMGEFYLVIFKWGFKDKKADRNLWRLDVNFNTIWKIQPLVFEKGQVTPYSSIRIKDGELQVYNYDGVYVKLDFETGEIEKIPGQRPW